MPALIAAIITILRALLLARAITFVASLLATLGLTIAATHYVVTPLVNQVRTLASSLGSFGQFGAVAIQWAGILQLDVAATMMLSAFVIAFAVKSGKVALHKV